MMRCYEWLRGEFKEASRKRGDDPDVWIPEEIASMTRSANLWALVEDIDRTITEEQVTTIDTYCSGHVDYASKLCLRIAELLYA